MENNMQKTRKFVLVSADFSGVGFAIQEIQKNDSEVIIAYKPKEEVEEEYSMGGWGKEIAIVTAFDYTPETALEHAVENAYKVKFCNSDFRTDCDCTFSIYNYGRGLAIQNFHHDSPMGEWYYILPCSEKTYEQYS